MGLLGVVLVWAQLGVHRGGAGGLINRSAGSAADSPVSPE